jgi:hypothetical protein
VLEPVGIHDRINSTDLIGSDVDGEQMVLATEPEQRRRPSVDLDPRSTSMSGGGGAHHRRCTPRRRRPVRRATGRGRRLRERREALEQRFVRPVVDVEPPIGMPEVGPCSAEVLARVGRRDVEDAGS